MKGGYWSLMIEELQASGVTLATIAAEVGVTIRQVSKWKNGSQPVGVTAIRLYKFHAEHRTSGHRPEGHLVDHKEKADIPSN